MQVLPASSLAKAALTTRFWYELGMNFLKKNAGAYRNRRDFHMRRYKSNFGCTPTVLCKCWILLLQFTDCHQEDGVTPLHLIWACFYLKVYGKEATNVALAGCDEKTFRKWIKIVIYALADLAPHVVSLSLFAFS